MRNLIFKYIICNTIYYRLKVKKAIKLQQKDVNHATGDLSVTLDGRARLVHLDLLIKTESKSNHPHSILSLELLFFSVFDFPNCMQLQSYLNTKRKHAPVVTHRSALLRMLNCLLFMFALVHYEIVMIESKTIFYFVFLAHTLKMFMNVSFTLI